MQKVNAITADRDNGPNLECPNLENRCTFEDLALPTATAMEYARVWSIICNLLYLLQWLDTL